MELEPESSPGEEPEEPEQRRLFANQLTTSLLMLEGSLGLVGAVGGYWSGVDWLALIQFSPVDLSLGLGGGVGLFLLHVVLLFPGGERNPLYRWIYKPFSETLAKRLRILSLEDIILISLMSGVAEEVMFRGWVQTELGLVAASILFGIIHIWGRQGIGYGVYAIGMGFILGFLFEYTGTLWAPMGMHSINNFLGLLSIKKGWTPD